MIFQRKKPRRVSAEVLRPLRRTGPPEISLLDPYERAISVGAFGVLAVVLAADPAMPAGRMVGLFVLLGLWVFLFSRYFLKFQAPFVQDLKSLIGMLGLCLVLLLIARILRESEDLSLLLTPLPLMAMMLASLTSPRFAVEACAFVSGLLALVWWGVDNLSARLITLFLGSVAGALYSFRIRRPSRLVAVGFLVGVTQLLCIGAIDLYREVVPAREALLKELLLALAQGLVWGFLAIGLMPFLEQLLGRLSDVTLLEYSNQNEQPVLRRLQVEAPGTHHHSFLVGTLAEAAAETIGANGLLCRVGAYFHDIGKMNKPEYFSENSPEARMRHRQISPEMSKLVITAHAKDGMELAEIYGVPEPIRAFIEEHHGTTAVEYFYRLAAQQRGTEDVQKEDYRYSGPRPRTKETAIAMLADSIEAASRTVRDPTPARLEQLIHDIVEMKIKDHQLDDCALTMRELTSIQEAFLSALVGIYHRRPSYPKDPTGKIAVPLAEDDLLPEMVEGRLPDSKARDRE